MTEKTFLVVQSNEEYPCSYLAGERARSLYIDPREALDEHALTLLSQYGFRRSGRLLYRPNCQQCQACQSARLLCAEFQPSRSQKRILKRNQDLCLRVTQPSMEYYPLFERYIQSRHRDGEMYPASEQQFADFLLHDFGNSGFLVAELNGEVVACMVFDWLQDGLSAVYCFYHPDLNERSLGSLMILRLSQLCIGLALPYNYLGYFVKNSPKMHYKSHFSPLELFYQDAWHRKDSV